MRVLNLLMDPNKEMHAYIRTYHSSIYIRQFHCSSIHLSGDSIVLQVEVGQYTRCRRYWNKVASQFQ